MTTLSPTEVLSSCRHCGHAEPSDLVRDQTIGEQPLIMCRHLADCHHRQENGTALRAVIADPSSLSSKDKHLLSHIHSAAGNCIKNVFVEPEQCPIDLPDGTTVRFKHEDDMDGEPIGPCGIVAPGQSTARPYDPNAKRKWFRRDAAVDVAARLNLPFMET